MGVKISNFVNSNLTGSDKIPFIKDGDSNNYIGTVSSLSASLIPVNSLTASFVTGSNVVGTVTSASYALSSSNLNSTGISTAASYRILGSKIGTPEMYGAVGDGITDDQKAFKHALISHSIVKLDAKTYAIRGYLGMPSYRTLSGEGKDKTIIKLMDNSPYGYDISGELNIIQASMQNDTIPVGPSGWTGSYNWTANGNVNNISGNIVWTGYGLNVDNSAMDCAVDSPNFGGGNLAAFDQGRDNITIKDLTIDCNFDNQARHSSFNTPDNPYSESKGGHLRYIPRYSFKVRPTIHAILLYGENNRVENVRVKNFGYGVACGSGSDAPKYNEEFPISLENAPNQVDGTGSLNNNDRIQSGVGNSKAKGNYVVNSEVVDIGSTDLLNPWSNTTAIYVTNQSVNLGTGQSNFSTDGGIYNCLVDPGERLFPTTASMWSGSYLDDWVNASLKQGSSTLGNWLLNGGSATGSNGDYAFSLPENGASVFKKISGSWIPQQNGNRYTHYVNAMSGYRMVNNTIKNSGVAFYLDSWRNNIFIENNQCIEVDSGFRFVVTDIDFTASFNNCIVRNNYIKLLSHDRYFISGHSAIMYHADLSKTTGSILRHVNNLQIENNTFELPISQSRDNYVPAGPLYTNPRYVGFYFGTETVDETLYKRKDRSVVIKNNHFLNWNAFTDNEPIHPGNELYNYNIPIFWDLYSGSAYEFDSADTDPNGPFPNTVTKFKQKALPNYVIEGNTYSSPFYPSTASLVPMTLGIHGAVGAYFYKIEQVNNVNTLNASTISASTISASTLNASTISASTISASDTISSSKLFLSYDAADALVSNGPVKVIVDAVNEHYVSQFTVNRDGTNSGLSANQINDFNYAYAPLILAATGSDGLILALAIGATRRQDAPNNTQTIADLGFHRFDSESYALSQSYIAGIGAFVQSATVGDRNGNLGFYTVSASNSNTEGRKCRAIIDYEGRMRIGVDDKTQLTERLEVRGNISSSGLIVPNSQSYANAISNSYQTVRTGSMVLTGSKLYIYTGLGSAAPFGAGWQTASLG